MKEIQFTVTPAEANLILEGVGAMPFAKVYQLVSKLQKQARRQNEAAPESAPVTEEPKAAE